MKHISLIQSIALTITFSLSLSAGQYKQPRALLKLARHIPTTKCSNVTRQQQRLLRMLQHSLPVEKIPPSTFSAVMYALAHKDTIHLLAKNEDLIQNSISLFYQTPGYFTVMKRILDNAAANDAKQFCGVLYELKTAVEIEESGTETVVEFGKKASDDDTSREIDLVTDARWIECKAWRTWPKRIVTSLQKQVVDQQKLMESHNKANQTNMRFQVSFQAPIPEHLQRWFAQRRIEYTD